MTDRQLVETALTGPAQSQVEASLRLKAAVIVLTGAVDRGSVQAERSARVLIRLTWALVAFTVALVVLSVALLVRT